MLAGHLGISKALDLHLHWPWKRRRGSVLGCTVGQKTKSSHQRPVGHLCSLELGYQLDLGPILAKTSSGNYHHWMVINMVLAVDCLTKWAIFLAATTCLTLAGLVEFFIKHVVSQHMLPTSIISNQESKFSSKFKRQLINHLGIKLKHSTADHPQTIDGRHCQ